MNDLPPKGGRIDQARTFKAINIAILSVSDTRTLKDDTSGDILVSRVLETGHNMVAREIVRDDIEQIQTIVKKWASIGAIDVIITTGGTGITGRDITPEAISPLLDKRIEGFSTIFHLVSFESVGLSTLQSRALAGIINGVFIFCLPGSNGACKDGWDKVIKWQLDNRHLPCNMVELMPRLKEK
jgi:molybdopterin adenylyltransferase